MYFYIRETLRMNAYLITRGSSCASLQLCPCAAVKCWVDVYDRRQSEEGDVRLRCGYISDTVEAVDLIVQLEKFLPLERWKELLLCSPGDWLQPRVLIRPEDLSLDKLCFCKNNKRRIIRQATGAEDQDCRLSTDWTRQGIITSYFTTTRIASASSSW